MNRPTLTLAALLAFSLLLAASWLLLHPSDGPVAPPGSDSKVPTATIADAVDPATRGVSPADLAPPIERHLFAEPTPLLPPPDDAEWIELRVVDATTRAPVPGATVGWYDSRITRELARRPQLLAERTGFVGAPSHGDPEAIARHFGWLATADAAGVARVQLATATTFFARDGERYGSVDLERRMTPPRDGFTLTIDADFSFCVQVLDATGAPAIGVPLGIATWLPEQSRLRIDAPTPEQRTWAPDGIAEFAHAQRWLPDPQLRVVVLLPGLPGEPITVTPGTPPVGRLTIQLPPLGRLKARLADPAQTRVGAKVWLRNAERGALAIGTPAWFDADGWARFAHVPLGMQVTLSTDAHGGSLTNVASGPRLAGEEVEVVLGPTQEHLLLTGRLVDANQRALADMPFFLRIQSWAHGGVRELRTDASGNFELLLGMASSPTTELAAIVVTTCEPGQTPLGGRLPGRPIAGGRTPLGDIVVMAAPLVVAGAFSVDGRPAQVRAELDLERYGLDAAGSPQWSAVPDEVQPSPSADGRFELRGHLEPGRYRLRVASERHQPVEPIEFALGSTDLTVALRTGRALTASLLLPDAARMALPARLVPIDPPLSQWQPDELAILRATVQKGAEQRLQLAWQGLPTGRYRLEVLLEGFSDPVLTVDDVLVPAPPAGDPRLVDLDLRQVVRVQRCRVLDARSQPVEARQLVLLAQPQAEAMVQEALPSHEIDRGILMPNRPVDVLVACRGHQPQTVVCSGEPIEVRLVPWPTVAVELPRIADWPPDWRLEASLAAPPDSETRRYRSRHGQGELADLLRPSLAWRAVVDRRVALEVGNLPQRVRLRAVRGQQQVDLPIPPQTVSASTGSWVVQLDAETLRRVLAEPATAR